jgi:hypothetical protein
MADNCSNGIWSKQSMARKAREQITQSAEPIEPQETSNTLKQEVKQALLNVLRSSDASAASKASAGRTLLEYYADDKSATKSKRGIEMSAADLDAAIAELE